MPTLIKRTSRFAKLVKAGGKDSDSIVSALIARAQHLLQGLMATMPRDRGTVLVYHRTFIVATDVSVFLCDPIDPWLRGSKEH